MVGKCHFMEHPKRILVSKLSVEITGPFPKGLLSVSWGPALGLPWSMGGDGSWQLAGDQINRKQLRALEGKQFRQTGILRRPEETGRMAQ